MRDNENIADALGEIREEENALDQSVALNKIVMQLLKTRAQECKRLWIALVISILVNLAIVGGFLWYESQWEYTTTTTDSTEIQQESEDSGLNLLQVGDNSRMFFGLEEGEDVQAVSENNQNDNQDSQP